VKKIETIYLKPSELKHDFGNPRVISDEKIKKLKNSIKKYGDHDIIKIDEEKNIISGNQRIKAMIELGIDSPVLCKQLIGFSDKELKAINIKSNEHDGEWDYNLLNEWKKEINEWDIDLDEEEIFSPILNPEQNNKMVDEKELKKAQQQIDNSIKIREDRIEVVCPKCGEEFFFKWKK
jgi:ParB-like chromosome segregation protein Spo0J